MAPNLGGWIHNFTVTDTQTHKGGYTLYKITSIVFPRAVPQALTQLVVWRRFHDIKRLHRDLKRRHKSLQMPGYLPEPIDCSFFKRFDRDVIQKRKEYILQLLDFAAQHAALYKCHAFTQFFNDINSSSKLHRFVQKAFRGFNKENACDDVDNEKSKSSLRPIETTSFQIIQVNETSDVEGNRDGGEEDEDETFPGSDGLIKNINSNTKRNKLHILTPMASVESEDSDYIYEAALEFSQAVQAEANLEYNEAFTRYKCGVDLLLHGCKEDCNDDRKFIAKAKITKYLARAEDIYERFLKTTQRSFTTTSSTNFQLAIDVSGNTNSDSSGLYLERPWNHMAKYKVNSLLGDKVLHVTCITEPLKPNYVMKGIEKPSSNSPTQTVFLPQHIPYMVDLLAFFQSDQKIFLLLKLALGGKVINYMHTYRTLAMKSTSFYCEGQQQASHRTPNSSGTDTQVSSDVNDLLVSSKQLIQSVSSTLKAVKCMDINLPQRAPPKTFEISATSGVPECQMKQWAEQLLVAIHALHEKSVILGDLHCDNLLLDENCQLLLTYFYQNEGVSSDSCIHKALSPKALDEHFVAPERPLTLRSDWWSFGVILYELFLGLSFKSAHPGQIDLYGFVQYPEASDLSETARDLLEKLLQQVPDERLDYEHIKQHKFFQDTNWEDVKRKGYQGNKDIHILK